MLKSRLPPVWRGMGRFTRAALEILLLLMIVGAVLVLTLRYRVLPEIEHYHERITVAMSAALGQKLTIGKIEADWDGLRPRLSFTDVKILDAQGQVALSLPRIENTVSWMSLPTMELRFHSLVIDRPDLSVRRDALGHWYVAGIPLDGESTSDRGRSDWLLHQSRVIVRNGRITWQDDLRAAPVLALEQVELRIENHGDRHRFAINALPPANLSSRLDVRGNFEGDSLSDLEGWSGQIYTQLDYADVPGWRRWVTLPDQFRRGKGALRIWVDVDQGQLSKVDADVALAGVQAKLSPSLPEFDLRELRGRIGWHRLKRGFEVVTKQLALQMRDGFKLKPTDFYLRLAGTQDALFSTGEVRANALELVDFGILAAYLPLSEELKHKVAEASPQGHIADLQAEWQTGSGDALRYEVKARFEGLSMHRVGERPGFAHLSGQVDGADSGGTLKLDSRKLMLDAPQLFAEPVEFDTFTARIGWQRNSHGMEIKLSNVDLANADLAGTIFGSYQTEPEGPGSIDASVDMTRVAVQRTGRYTPLPVVNKETHDWLQAALQGGQADSFRVRLRGDLRDFPFVGNERGVFRLEARAKGVVMEFDKDWPRLEEAQTHLLIQGNKLDIDAVSATTAGAHLQNIQVGIPDLLGNNLLLRVRGEVLDTTQRSLDYIQKSPVNGYLEGFTEGVKASGSGKLGLQLDIPLTGDAPVKVRGDYHFINNDVELGQDIPSLRNVNGVLEFTESSVSATDIGAQILGGPSHLKVHSEKGVLLTKVSGKADLDTLRQLDPHPLLNHIHGQADWSADIKVQGKLADVSVDANLQGVTLDLPEPFSKRSAERIPVHFEQKNLNARQNMLSLRYGTLVDAKLIRQRRVDGEWRIRRGRVALGGAAVQDDKEGVWVVGKLPRVSLEGWNGLGLESGSGGSFALPNIAGIDVAVDKLSGFGNEMSALDIKGSARNGLIKVRLASQELNGDLIWQPQGNGKLLGRFKNVVLDEGLHAPTLPEHATPGKEAKPVDNTGFPEVDIAVEKLVYKGRQLGKLELELGSAGKDIQLNNLKLTNPEGVVSMSGKWQAAPEQTQLKLRLDISDAGKILSRVGYSDSLKDGSGFLEADMHWVGGPASFNYSKLNGTVTLNVLKGRFLKVEPGVGKLLGVLSLQSIPRRISLDFTDVFSEGFQFDSIKGNAQISNGLLLTNDMKLAGPAAKVTMLGQVDMNQETQHLKVRILPTIGDNVSLLSFAAGPVVGVGVLLANKLLSDPLDKLVSFEYNVTGSWADPKVERLGQTKSEPESVFPGG